MEGTSDNLLHFGDNLRLMKKLAEDENVRGKIRMIYIDPPFFSKADYDAVISVAGKNVRHPAYNDHWHNSLYEYLRQLAARLMIMKELLADDGTIWVHLDWHAVHYVRLLMDEIFGAINFVNEIIWTYKSGGSTKRRFSRKHDNILVYSKTQDYFFQPLEEKSYNRNFKPYRFKGVKEYRDEQGWYTMVNMKDVWAIDMVGRTAAERTGYATQKPEQLLERIIASTSEPGDLVADFFCGSGTLPVVAARSGRRFIACDNGQLAAETCAARLAQEGIGFRMYAEEGLDFSERAQPRFEVQIGVKTETLPGGEERVWTIALQDVKERRMSRDMAEADKKHVKKTAKSDPLALIQSWSIDYDFDGKVHRPSQVLVRTKGKLTTEVEIFLKNREDRVICVKTVDVLGQVAYVLVRSEFQ